MRPRVLFVSYTGGWSGPTNSLLHLLRYLDGRYQVGVAVPRQGRLTRELEQQGVPFYEFGSLTKSAIPGLWRLIRREGFDLVYGNNPGSGSKNALIAAKLARVPFICHVRGMGQQRGWRHLAFLRFSDTNIAVSHACADAVTKYAGGRRPTVIHNGIALDGRWAVERSVARSQLLEATGFPAESRIIVGLAHICRRKAQGHAVEGLARAAERCPSARLALIGALENEPDYVDELRGTIHRLGLEERVSLLGRRWDIEPLLVGADVFVHTALADPHPRAVLEAMAARLPVVAFSVDGVAETVLDSRTGYLVPARDVELLGDALARVLGDAGLGRRLGCEGYRRVTELFSAETTARRVGEVIDRTLAERRNGFHAS